MICSDLRVAVGLSSLLLALSYGCLQFAGVSFATVEAGEEVAEPRLACENLPDVFVWRGSMHVDGNWRGHLDVRMWRKVGAIGPATWEARERFDALSDSGFIAERSTDFKFDASLLPIEMSLRQEPGGGTASLSSGPSGTVLHPLSGGVKSLPLGKRYPLYCVTTALLYGLTRGDSKSGSEFLFHALSLEDGRIATAGFRERVVRSGGQDRWRRAMAIDGGISYDIVDGGRESGILEIGVDRGVGRIERDADLLLESLPVVENAKSGPRHASIAARLSLLLATGNFSGVPALCDTVELRRRSAVPDEVNLEDWMRELSLRHQALFEGESQSELHANVLGELALQLSASDAKEHETSIELGGGLGCVIAERPSGPVVVEILDAEKRCLDIRLPCATPYVAAARWRLGLVWGRPELVDAAADWTAIAASISGPERGNVSATRSAALQALLKNATELDRSVEVRRAVLSSLAREYDRLRFVGRDSVDLVSKLSILRITRKGKQWRVSALPVVR